MAQPLDLNLPIQIYSISKICLEWRRSLVSVQQLREMATMSTMAARMTVQPQRGARNGTRARSPRPCLRLRMNSSSAPLRVTLMEAQRWTRTWLGKDAGMWPGNATRASITKLNLLAPRAAGSGLPAHDLPH